MALTNAERKKRYFDNLKATGKFDEYKRKNASNAKKRRDRVNAGLGALPKNVREKTKRRNREYTRRKMAEYRQRKKEEKGVLVDTTNQASSVETTTKSVQIIPDDGSYKTTSALAKALAKVKRALPSTSQKQKQVVDKLALTFASNGVKHMVANKITKAKRTKGLSALDVDVVKGFYERDDVSRISPNVKDCRKFVNPITGVEEFKQLRFLMYKLAEVYVMFEKHVKNGNDAKNPPVRFSKFCELRPNHVKLVGDTPLDQCLCYYHQNFILCCTAINLNMPEFPKYGPKFEELILCRNPKKDCWMRKCVKCPNTESTLAEILKRSGKRNDNSTIWTQWIKNKDTKRFQKLVQQKPLENLLEYFFKILPEFLKHSFIKRKQAASFEKDNEEAKHSNGEVATLQVDFSESYNCDGQDEIQCAHWNQPTV